MPIVLLLSACAVLSSCAAAPPKPQPINVKLNIIASADVNPDAQSRPSPIVVRIFQLKDDAAFKDADFFTLYDKEEATLAASLVSRVEYEVAPGETHVADYAVAPETRFIGVIAAYRSIRDAQWRVISGPAEKGAFDAVKNGKLGIAVDRARVHFAATH